MANQSPKDRKGKTIIEGSNVKLIELEDDFIERLDIDAKKQVLSMIGQKFEVCEIDAYGQPWIEKEWSCEDGTSTIHTLSLLPHQIELC